MSSSLDRRERLVTMDCEPYHGPCLNLLTDVVMYLLLVTNVSCHCPCVSPWSPLCNGTPRRKRSGAQDPVSSRRESNLGRTSDSYVDVNREPGEEDDVEDCIGEEGVVSEKECATRVEERDLD